MAAWFCRDAFGRLAQLVRAPALQAGGHWFESNIAHKTPIGYSGRGFLFCGVMLLSVSCGIPLFLPFATRLSGNRDSPTNGPPPDTTISCDRGF